MLINYTAQPQEFEGKLYDQRHGGPFDRGAADSYYNRGFNPHFYEAATQMSPRIERDSMTTEDILAYTAGYLFNEKHGDKKQWY